MAARLVWMSLEKMVSEASQEVRGLSSSDVRSFFYISTVFEKFGDGSNSAALVATMARQEQEGEVQGVSTVEWIRFIVDDMGVSLGSQMLKTRASVLKVLNDFVSAYEELPEVQAYDEAKIPVGTRVLREPRGAKSRPRRKMKRLARASALANESSRRSKLIFLRVPPKFWR